MAFEGLSEKLNGLFKRLRGKGRLTESDVREAMREVRLALLEADVSFKVVKEFVASVTERAVGAAEERMYDLEQAIQEASADYLKLQELYQQREALEDELAHLYANWERLSAELEEVRG